MTSTLEQLQAAVAVMLTVDSVFSGGHSANGKAIPVLTEKRADLISYASQQIAMLGIGVIILTPIFKLQNPKVNSKTGDCRIWVQVSELPMVNQGSGGTGLTAATLACRVIELLHWKSHNVVPDVEPRQQLMTLTDCQIAGSPPGQPQRTMTYNLIFNADLVIKTI